MIVRSVSYVKAKKKLIINETKEADFLFYSVNEKIKYTNLDYLEDSLRQQIEYASAIINTFAALLIPITAAKIVIVKTPEGLSVILELFALVILLIILSLIMIQLFSVTKKRYFP